MEQIQADLELFQKNGQKSEDLQGFQNPNNVANYYLTTYQQPTKVVGMVVGSDAPAENLCVKETAHAPLGGASPPVKDCASESEEPPAVADCTSLTLVDAAQDQSASLEGENQASGNEPEVSDEDTISAAPVAPDFEKSSTQAETKLHPEQEYSASLSADNPISRAEPENLHELANSAPQVEVVTTSTKNSDKWSDEAIQVRMQARSGRISRLKSAEILRSNPGFEYLQECWEEDPALQIVIKKLLAKFPQWGIACVEGQLVDWNG